MSFPTLKEVKQNWHVTAVVSAVAATITYLGRTLAPFAQSSLCAAGVFGLVATKTADLVSPVLNRSFLKNKTKGEETIYRFVAKYLVGGAAAFGVSTLLAATGYVAAVGVVQAVAFTAVAMVAGKAIPRMAATIAEWRSTASST